MDNKSKFITRTILIILIILPILFAVFYILVFGVNVPIVDQWYQEVLSIKEFYDGTLTVADLFSQHNESRPFFPRLISIVIGVISGYNLWIESFLALCISILSFIILFLMYKKDQGTSNRSLLLFLPIAYFYFNLYLIGNSLFGIHFGHSLTIFGFFFAVYVLSSYKTSYYYLIAAMVASIVSSFSFIAGLAIWPVCFLQIWLEDSPAKIKRLIIWGFSWVAVYLIYFIGYTKPSQHPSLFYAFEHYYTAIFIFFMEIGSNIVHSVIIAPIIGLLFIFVLLLLIVSNRENGIIKQNVKWISLILFSLIMALEITIARAGFEQFEWLIDIKYFQIMFMGIIGLYCISLNTIFGNSNEISPPPLSSASQIKNGFGIGRTNLNWMIFGMILLLLLIGIGCHTIQGIEYGKYARESREGSKYILKTYSMQIDSRLDIPDDASGMRELASFLEAYNLSVFAEKGITPSNLPTLKNDTIFWSDLINGEVFNKDELIKINKSANSEFTLEGWAIDSEKMLPAGAVFVIIGDQEYPTYYSFMRPDIAKKFNNKNLMNVGFRLSLSSDYLPLGNNRIRLKIVNHDKNGVYIPEETYHIFVTD